MNEDKTAANAKSIHVLTAALVEKSRAIKEIVNTIIEEEKNKPRKPKKKRINGQALD